MDKNLKIVNNEDAKILFGFCRHYWNSITYYNKLNYNIDVAINSQLKENIRANAKMREHIKANKTVITKKEPTLITVALSNIIVRIDAGVITLKEHGQNKFLKKYRLELVSKYALPDGVYNNVAISWSNGEPIISLNTKKCVLKGKGCISQSTLISKLKNEFKKNKKPYMELLKIQQRELKVIELQEKSADIKNSQKYIKKALELEASAKKYENLFKFNLLKFLDECQRNYGNVKFNKYFIKSNEVQKDKEILIDIVQRQTAVKNGLCTSEESKNAPLNEILKKLGENQAEKIRNAINEMCTDEFSEMCNIDYSMYDSNGFLTSDKNIVYSYYTASKELEPVEEQILYYIIYDGKRLV